MAEESENGDSQVQPWTVERLMRASYKDLGSPAEVEDRFYRYLVSSETSIESLRILLMESSATTRDYSISIDMFDFLDADPVLGSLLLRFPATLLPLLENAVVRAQREILGRDDEQHDPGMTIKGERADGRNAATRVHARLVHLPPFCFKTSLASMQAQDVGKIVQVTGTVVRTSPVQMYESARTYKCAGTKGCGRTFVVHADMEQRHNALQQPERCPLVSSTGEPCPGTKLQAVQDGSVHTDYQEIKIQEAASRLSVGHIPRSLLVKLQHDLVDKCQPGDEVIVVGSLLAQWQQPSIAPDVSCQVGMAMSAHSVRVVAEKGSSAWQNSKDALGDMDKFRQAFDAYWSDPAHQTYPIAARDFICKAVCPKLYGLQIIKLALLLTLIGGVSSDAYQVHQGRVEDSIELKEDAPDQFHLSNAGQPGAHSDTTSYSCFGESSSNRRHDTSNEQVKTRRRDQSHLLLVGDPGTGKSQILRFAAALCPRSVLTTGVGTTSAGLTCAAVREGNGKEFSLEAGALVLADKGVCCIDEFGVIQEQDRTTIHEAMEQQTLSVAKAGIVCKLNCRATIIAVMNPRDCLYDNHTSLSANTGLGTPLLSRFDLIFKLVDSSDAERDSNVTTYLLNRAIQGAGTGESTDLTQGDKDIWSMEKLRAYISIVKGKFQPTMSDAAAALLERHYKKCRSAQSNTIPVTVRFLESLIRLSQAHARLMFRNDVTLEDAVAVIRLMECSAFAYGGFDGHVDDSENVLYVDPMTIDFSSEPDLDFLCFQYRIMQRYGMLDHLDDDRRRQALAVLDKNALANTRGWHDTARSAGWSQPQAAGEATNPWFATNTPNIGGSTWANAASGSCHGSAVCEDHYGRLQVMSQPFSQSKRKRA